MSRLSYQDNSDASDLVFTLLDTTFPGISTFARERGELGRRWEEVSVPFVHFHEDRAVSHVGLIELNMMVDGKTTRAAGLHAVATRPDQRRRGFFRSVMEEALEHCRDHYELLLLTTSRPELYTPFGFRVVKEHRFHGRCTAQPGNASSRVLDLHRDEDLTALNRLLDQRDPVSNLLGLHGEKAIFFFNEGGRPLHYLPDLDCVLCIEVHDETMHIYDVVAPQMPTLAAILKRMGFAEQSVITYFSPDKLCHRFTPQQYVLDGDSFLMIRGEFAAEGKPLMLPRTARC